MWLRKHRRRSPGMHSGSSWTGSTVISFLTELMHPQALWAAVNANTNTERLSRCVASSIVRRSVRILSNFEFYHAVLDVLKNISSFFFFFLNNFLLCTASVHSHTHTRALNMSESKLMYANTIAISVSQPAVRG